MQHYTSHCIDIYGNAISGASIQVYAAGTLTASTIYSDNGVTTTTNPLTSGSDGSFDFYAANGRYDLVITHTGHTFSSTDTAGIALFDPVQTTWTPSVGGNATYTTQEGTYSKIGLMVFVRCRLVINVLGTGSATTISGLPYPATELSVGTVGYFSGCATAVTWLGCYVSSSTIIMSGLTAAATGVTQPLTTFQNATQVYLTAVYTATS